MPEARRTVKIEERTVIAGDPYDLRILFGIDVSDCEFTASLDGLPVWNIDTSAAATGEIWLRLTSEQTALLDPLTLWNLSEDVRWRRTLFEGRLRRRDVD